MSKHNYFLVLGEDARHGAKRKLPSPFLMRGKEEIARLTGMGRSRVTLRPLTDMRAIFHGHALASFSTTSKAPTVRTLGLIRIFPNSASARRRAAERALMANSGVISRTGYTLGEGQRASNAARAAL